MKDELQESAAFMEALGSSVSRSSSSSSSLKQIKKSKLIKDSIVSSNSTTYESANDPTDKNSSSSNNNNNNNNNNSLINNNTVNRVIIKQKFNSFLFYRKMISVLSASNNQCYLCKYNVNNNNDHNLIKDNHHDIDRTISNDFLLRLILKNKLDIIAFNLKNKKY